MIHVTNSKNIASIDFEPRSGDVADHGVLITTFRNGRTYAYQGVPAGVYEALVAENDRAHVNAEDASVGKTFNSLVKGGGYTFSEIT